MESDITVLVLAQHDGRIHDTMTLHRLGATHAGPLGVCRASTALKLASASSESSAYSVKPSGMSPQSAGFPGYSTADLNLHMRRPWSMAPSAKLSKEYRSCTAEGATALQKAALPVAALLLQTGPQGGPNRSAAFHGS